MILTRCRDCDGGGRLVFRAARVERVARRCGGRDPATPDNRWIKHRQQAREAFALPFAALDSLEPSDSHSELPWPSARSVRRDQIEKGCHLPRVEQPKHIHTPETNQSCVRPSMRSKARQPSS